MSDKQQPKLFGARNPVLLGQNIDCVLLRVRCNDVAVVPLLVVLAGGKGQQGLDLELLYGVDGPPLRHMENLHSTLPVLTLKDLETLLHHFAKSGIHCNCIWSQQLLTKYIHCIIKSSKHRLNAKKYGWFGVGAGKVSGENRGKSRSRQTGSKVMEPMPFGNRITL